LSLLDFQGVSQLAFSVASDRTRRQREICSSSF
jgi:hypothetical protein